MPRLPFFITIGNRASRKGPSPHPALSPAALADFDEPKRSTFVMFGVLTIAVRIYHDRRGYGVYSGPIGSAILIIAAKWVRTCEPQRSGRLPWRRLFPLGVSTHLPSCGSAGWTQGLS